VWRALVRSCAFARVAHCALSLRTAETGVKRLTEMVNGMDKKKLRMARRPRRHQSNGMQLLNLIDHTCCEQDGGETAAGPIASESSSARTTDQTTAQMEAGGPKKYFPSQGNGKEALAFDSEEPQASFFVSRNSTTRNQNRQVVPAGMSKADVVDADDDDEVLGDDDDDDENDEGDPGDGEFSHCLRRGAMCARSLGALSMIAMALFVLSSDPVALGAASNVTVAMPVLPPDTPPAVPPPGPPMSPPLVPSPRPPSQPPLPPSPPPSAKPSVPPMPPTIPPPPLAPPILPVPEPEAPPSPLPPPPLPPPPSVTQRFNARWASGAPTSDLAAAGVIMRPLAGDGVGPRGFETPSMESPLAMAGSPDPFSFNGDRLRAQIVNSRHPDIRRCGVGCPEEWQDLPGLILSPTAAISDRILCAGWRDIGSLRYNCNPLGKPGCTPGCPPREQWCDQRGGVEQQTACSMTAAPTTMQECCIVWPAWQLSEMMRMQDIEAGAFGSSPARFSNELVLDKWSRPWEDELSTMIEGVFVLPSSSMAVKAYAAAVHKALLAKLKVDANAVPFVLYDASATEAPFTEIRAGAA
jgi:hypothetical protein